MGDLVERLREQREAEIRGNYANENHWLSAITPLGEVFCFLDHARTQIAALEYAARVDAVGRVALHERAEAAEKRITELEGEVARTRNYGERMDALAEERLILANTATRALAQALDAAGDVAHALHQGRADIAAECIKRALAIAIAKSED